MNTLGIYPPNSKILIIGPYPPPLGGISVHVKRLKRILDDAGHVVDLFYNTRGRGGKIFDSTRLFKKLIFNNYDIVHVQGYFRSYILTVLLGRYFRNFALFYTEHNPRIFDGKNLITCYLIKGFIEKLGCLIVVADHIIEKYKEYNVKLPENIHIQNAFLPPPVEEEDLLFQSYSPETKKFLASRRPLLIANAFQIKFHNNVDLYGLDLCVELTKRLKDAFPEVGLLFALANDHINVDYIENIKAQIRTMKLEKNFHFMTGQKELWPLFKKADLSIRPTTTDGDAISIRESIFFNCPVIASDVIPRPEGTVTFRSRDINDLTFKVLRFFSNKNFDRCGNAHISDDTDHIFSATE